MEPDLSEIHSLAIEQRFSGVVRVDHASRTLMATAYGLEHCPAERPDDVDWSALPERCVVQLHWHRVDPLVERLARHQVRVVVVARHPLDVLISLLSWVDNCPGPREIWRQAPSLAGDGGDESPLFGATPVDESFAAYASGPRSRALLSVSLQWWRPPAP